MKLLNKAFTIIELIFVIVVIGILAAVAIPRIQQKQANIAIEQSLTESNKNQNNTTEW